MTDERIDEAKIYVGNLNFSVNEEELKSEFCKFGEISHIVLIKDRETDKSKGFGFITYESQHCADDAIAQMHQANLKERPMTVNKANPRKGGGYGGGRQQYGSGSRYDERGSRGGNRRYDNRGYNEGGYNDGGYSGGGHRSYNDGGNRGYNDGGSRGHNDGGNRGYNDGGNRGYNDGGNRGYNDGGSRGYSGDGYNDRKGGNRDNRGGGYSNRCQNDGGHEEEY